MNPTKLHPLGIELTAVPSNEEEWNRVPELMEQGKGVVVIRGLDLDGAGLEAVLKKFASCMGHRLLTYDRWPGQSPGVAGCKHLALLGNYRARKPNEFVEGCAVGDRIAEFKPATMDITEWHTDGSFLKCPKTYISLYAPASQENALPTQGGETRFCSTKMSPSDQAKYKGWTTVHSWRAFMRFLEARDPSRPKVTEEQCREKPDQTWPLVRGNGCMYINPKNTSAVYDSEGNAVDPSIVLKLAQQLIDENGVYWHKWQPGDLVIWDNQVLLHAATPFDSTVYQRLLYRAEFGPYFVPSSVETVKWGYLEPADPVATVSSGSTVVVDTVSGTMLPPAESFHRIPAELFEIHTTIDDRVGPHILTGPIAVESANPGDVLKIDILDIRLRSDWAYTIHKPSGQVHHTCLKGNTAETPWGSSLECEPFFGVLGVASQNRVSSVPPSSCYGGNLDLRLLTSGSTLYIPVHQKGALLFVGDGHARQGDGECCGTALETALTGTFRLTVLKQEDFTVPFPGYVRAETPEALISIGVLPTVDAAVKEALDHMSEWLMELGRPAEKIDAECLCSVAGNVAVTQIVNGNTRGAHVVLQKKHLPPLPE